MSKVRSYCTITTVTKEVQRWCQQELDIRPWYWNEKQQIASYCAKKPYDLQDKDNIP